MGSAPSRRSLSPPPVPVLVVTGVHFQKQTTLALEPGARGQYVVVGPSGELMFTVHQDYSESSKACTYRMLDTMEQVLELLEMKAIARSQFAAQLWGPGVLSQNVRITEVAGQCGEPIIQAVGQSCIYNMERSRTQENRFEICMDAIGGRFYVSMMWLPRHPVTSSWFISIVANVDVGVMVGMLIYALALSETSQ